MSGFTKIPTETSFTGNGPVTRNVIEDVLEAAGQMGYFDSDCPVSVYEWTAHDDKPAGWRIEVSDPQPAPVTTPEGSEAARGGTEGAREGMEP